MLRSTMQSPETGATAKGRTQQVASIVARSLASGDMADRDRSYLAQVVAANTDMDAEAARARGDEINAVTKALDCTP